MEKKDAKKDVAAKKVVKFGPRKIAKDDTKKTQVKAEAKKTASKPKAEPKKEPFTLTFKRAAFQKDIAVAADFTAKKSTVPVLSHILFDSDGQGHCRVMTTDLEVSWSRIITCKGQKGGRCVPAALLLKEVKALPEKELDVVLEFKDNIVTVNGRCKLFTLSADDFPRLPEIKKWTELQMDNFVSGLKEVSAAMGDGDTRYTLNGVYLDLSANKVVATDGHRLHFENIRVRGDKAQPIIIPSRAVALMLKYPFSEIPKLIREKGKQVVGEHINKPQKFDLDVFGHKVKAEYEPQIYKGSFYSVSIEFKGPVSESGFRSEYLSGEEVKKRLALHGSLKDAVQVLAEEMYLTYSKTVAVTVSEKFMTYPAAGGEMLIKIVEGNYPKYTEIIPKDSPIRVSFSAKDFLQNMEGAIPVTESVTLKINSSLTIHSQSPDRGDYKWHIPCKTEGKKKDMHLDMRFNAKYLIDAIKAYASQDVLLELKEPLSPCLVNKKAVVMPMRLEKPESKKAA
jgi:DNA polymerase III sliding clamp (beta) subunit (PCNA family)